MTHRNWSGAVLVAISVGIGIAAAGCASDDESLAALQQGVGGVTGVGGGGVPTSPLVFGRGGGASSTSDATIGKDQPKVNFGSASKCTIDGRTAQRQCLIRWNFSLLPPTVIVESATVRLFVALPSAAAFTLTQLNASWTEAGVTFDERSPGNPWSTPGAKHVPNDRAASPILTFYPSPGWKELPLGPTGVAMVQSWVTNPNTNHGIVISSTTTLDSFRIDASEVVPPATAPELVVAFH